MDLSHDNPVQFSHVMRLGQKIKVSSKQRHHICPSKLPTMCLRASEINMANTAHQQPLQAEYLSDDEDPSPLPPSPINIIYSSEKEAIDAINEFTQQHGYALTTKSSKRHGNNQIKACYHCDCSDVHKNNVADDKQVHEKITHCENCPFHAILH